MSKTGSIQLGPFMYNLITEAITIIYGQEGFLFWMNNSGHGQADYLKGIPLETQKLTWWEIALVALENWGCVNS
jgi:hypothetical protein